ncbi:MAG: cell division protein FtsZ, partial [Campylobacterales bacterium]|nr:cell division protein FtsZ [Campylobacterales bacterium]
MGFKIQEAMTPTGAKIKVVGVGGAGGNMVNHMINFGINGVEMVVANTDTKALHSNQATTKIQIGEKTTRGLGAGMVPDVGKQSAVESFDELKSSLMDSDIVFIAAGLGGGTGTGAAPIVAQAAKEVGALTVSVVTKPFKFEGKKRAYLADIGLEELKKESDSIIVIYNEKLLSIVEKNLGLKDSFRLVDDILARAVAGMCTVILQGGNNDISVDFADVRTVMSHRGLALMGVGESSGNNAAYEASKSAIESPLLDNLSINGALGVLVHFQIHPSYPLHEISEAMSMIEESADPNANVIFGTTTDENLDEHKVKVTIVATGFEKELSKKEHEISSSNLKLV